MLPRAVENGDLAFFGRIFLRKTVVMSLLS
jgi:hypothetical protein